MAVDNQLLIMVLAALTNRHGGLVEVSKAELECLEVCDVSWGYDSDREVMILKVNNRPENGTDTSE